MPERPALTPEQEAQGAAGTEHSAGLIWESLRGSMMLREVLYGGDGRGARVLPWEQVSQHKRDMFIAGLVRSGMLRVVGSLVRHVSAHHCEVDERGESG